MISVRKYITYVLLLTLLFGEYGSVAWADDTVVNSLDALPSMSSALSEPTDDFSSLIAEKQAYEIVTPVEIPEAIIPTEELIVSASVMLAERETYIASRSSEDILTPSMIPGFVTDPLAGQIFSMESVMAGFLASYQSPSISEQIDITGRIQQERKVSSTRGTIRTSITPGTIITTSTGLVLDASILDIVSISDSGKAKAKKRYEKKMKNRGTTKKGLAQASPQGFEFGLSGTHLIFSSPVAITIDIPNASDGIAIDLMTEHAGDADFHTVGLSVDATTTCNTDGSASKPGSQAVVKNGKVTFYTCGASTFTMNTNGGVVGSNDIKLIIGDCGQFQLYYNGAVNMYTGNPPATTGCNTTLDNWIALRIGATTYWSEANNWTTASTTGSQNGNTYNGTTILTRLVGAFTYTLVLNWQYLAPNKFFTINYSLTIPTGNTNNVRFYLGNDSMAGGDDANDLGYTGSAPTRTIGVYDNAKNQTSAIRYLSGTMWTAEEVSPYGTINTRISGGTDFNNTIQKTAGDLGFGVNWNFGTTPGTYSGAIEWRTLPYITANVVDLVPGIGQPEGSLTVGYTSRLPITVTNAGNMTSSGIHTTIFTLPANVTGPSSAFVDNGWSCGAQVSTTVTCTKTTAIASLGTETFYISVVPAPAAGGTTVRFNLSLSNPGDSNTTNNTAFASNAVVAATLTFAPGGMTGATLWLKANGNKNCSTNGCTITTWNNSGSIIAANAVTGLGTVTYDTTNQMNYNPTLYFNAASLNTNSNLAITTAAASVFTATRIGAGGSFLIGPQTAVANALDWSTSPTIDRLARYTGTVIYNGANLRGAGTADITSTSRATGGAATNRTDGLQTLTNATVATAFVGASIGIGRSVAANSTLANVGEIIIYPTELTGVPRNKVESYLAIKYGITLDQTTAQNYTLSNNAVAWNSALAGTFIRDIAGIARDDISSLSQVKSQSVNNTGDIIVNTVGAIGSNYQSLIWANDGATTSSFSVLDSPPGYQHVAREWQFQEKNIDIGNVKVSYPVSALPVGAISPLYMFVDNNSIFATGSSIYTGTLVGANWEFIANIADMQYITFGQGAGDTVAPVISSTSIASGALIPIGTFALTYNYSDTGSAIAPASATGQIYSWNSGTLSYNAVPLAGNMTIGSAGTGSATMNIANLPYGRYRFDLSIADTLGNISTRSFTYYVDAIEWTISADTYNIGNITQNIATFGTGELIVTVRTVGAGFALSSAPTSPLAIPSGDTINYWNGTYGVGYDLWNGTAFLGTIITYSPNTTLATVAKSINSNGERNTFTYRIKYGAQVDFMQKAGDYNGTVQFGLSLDY